MKHVFVLGAGASAAACGTPLGRDLVWKYHKDCFSPVEIKGGTPDTTEEDREFQNYVRFLEVVARHYPKLKDETKRFLRRGYYVYSPPEGRPYIDQILDLVQEGDDKEATELIRIVIFEHLVEVILVERKWRHTLYDEFTNNILGRLEPEDVSVISTNFDYLLCEHFQSSITFDYCLDFDWVDDNRSNYRKHPAIPLIKLNGSLDWGHCGTCRQLHLLFPHMHRTFFETKRCHNGCGPLRPLIVVPHERHSTVFEKLWSRTKEVLSHADIVTIVGYSFPEYDHDIIDLFNSATPVSAKLEVIDYCEVEEDRPRDLEKQKRRYKGLFPGLDNIAVNLDGFQKYVENYRTS